jgi:two-component system sensor histidine kinase RpfC
VHAARSARLYPENVVSLGEHYSRLPSSPERPLRILVAEDNETNRQVTRAILERAGHRLTMVEDGEAALDMLRERVADFDLLLLDKNMPGRNGLEVFQALRFMYPGISLPTIMLSADATLDTIAECRAAGVHAYLTKPVESRRLLETIQDIGRGKEATDVGNQTDQPPRGHPEEEETALFDDEKLDSLLNLDQDGIFFQELAEGFQRDTERSVNAIAMALKSADYPAMRAAVHALQGSSSELGANGLAAAAVRLRTLKPVELQSPQAEGYLTLLREAHTATLAYIVARQLASHPEATPSSSVRA